MDRETFREYLEALDNVDVEALTTRFYHPEFSTEIGGETLDLAGLLDFEKTLKSVADPHFEPVQIVMDESGIAMDAVRTLVVLHDADVPVVGPARKETDGRSASTCSTRFAMDGSPTSSPT